MKVNDNYKVQKKPSFGIAKFKGYWHSGVKETVKKTELFKQTDAGKDVVNIVYQQSFKPGKYSKAVKFIKEKSGIIGIGKTIAKIEGMGKTLDDALISLIRGLAGV